MIKFIFTLIGYVLHKFVIHVLNNAHIFFMMDIHIKRFHLIIMIKW